MGTNETSTSISLGGDLSSWGTNYNDTDLSKEEKDWKDDNDPIQKI